MTRGSKKPKSTKGAISLSDLNRNVMALILKKVDANNLRVLRRVSKAGSEFNKGMINGRLRDLHAPKVQARARGKQTRSKFTRQPQIRGVKILNYQGQSRVKTQVPGGMRAYFKGPESEERLVRIESHDGTTKQYYEGPMDNERMVRKVDSNGFKYFYNGPKNNEQLVRMEGFLHKVYFNGLKGEERKVITKHPDGSKSYFKGQKGQERVVRVESPDGSKTYYEGEKGQEQVVRIEKPKSKSLERKNNNSINYNNSWWPQLVETNGGS